MTSKSSGHIIIAIIIVMMNGGTFRMLDKPRYVTDPAPIYTPSVSSCKAPGCTCKDARIFSRRKAEFVRFLAQQRGQTVDRVIEARPTDLANVLLNEPQVSGPADLQVVPVEDRPANACTCAQCDARCSGIMTVAQTGGRCRECALGAHVAR